MAVFLYQLFSSRTINPTLFVIYFDTFGVSNYGYQELALKNHPLSLIQSSTFTCCQPS